MKSAVIVFPGLNRDRADVIEVRVREQDRLDPHEPHARVGECAAFYGILLRHDDRHPAFPAQGSQVDALPGDQRRILRCQIGEHRGERGVRLQVVKDDLVVGIPVCVPGVVTVVPVERAEAEGRDLIVSAQTGSGKTAGPALKLMTRDMGEAPGSSGSRPGGRARRAGIAARRC